MTYATVNVDLQVKLKPIRVPNYILVEGETGSVSVLQLEVEALEALCAQFRADLFEKAGKDLPK